MKILFVVSAAMVLLGSAGVAVAGDPAAGQEKSATCAACHGPQGVSTNPEWPHLAGQHAGYLEKQLQNFKHTDRENARIEVTMNGMAAGLSDEDMADLAAFYAAQSPQFGTADPELVELGERLYRGGDLARGISACAACHGGSGMGNPAADFPLLAGQHATYTEMQLKAFRSGARYNDNGEMMRNIAARMSDEDIRAVASYIQGLRP